MIHQQLQSQGVISKTDHETTILVNREDRSSKRDFFKREQIENTA